jgi:protein TonB
VTAPPPRDGTGLAAPITISAALHAAVLAGLVVTAPGPPPPMPPVYRVNLVAAPPAERAIGVVRPPAASTPPPAAATPPRPVTSSPDAAPVPTKPRVQPPRRTPAQATPTPEPTQPERTETKAPTAGGGPVGDKGADVATVRTEGIEFPYPGYLQNIVRQIALRFKPPRGSRRAEVMFLIHRDGTISNLNFRVTSGSYAFDVEARGAVESAAEARAFGPLPRGFPDDVLPVIFSFDPRLIR